MVLKPSSSAPMRVGKESAHGWTIRRAGSDSLTSRLASRRRNPTGIDASPQTMWRERCRVSPTPRIWAMTRAMADGDEPEDRNRAPPLIGDGARPQVRYIGHAKDTWRDTYHVMLTMPLWVFFAVMGGGYLAVNTVFALAYMVVGGVSGVGHGDFTGAFFFSAETFSTVGYGQSAPQTFAAHAVVTVESFCGLFNLAIATGLLFARISRPTARVVFSDRMVVTIVDGEPTPKPHRRGGSQPDAGPRLEDAGGRDVPALRGDGDRAHPLAGVRADLDDHAPDQRVEPPLRRDDGEPDRPARGNPGHRQRLGRDLRPDHPCPGL